MILPDTFHSGEREVQIRTGEQDRALINGGLIRDAIPPNAINFVAQQQSCVLGWTSPDGDIWGTFLALDRGFASTNESGTILSLHFDNPTSPTGVDYRDFWLDFRV